MEALVCNIRNILFISLVTIGDILQSMPNIDTLVKISTIITPFITLLVWWLISERISIGQNVYQKREVIYREFFKKIEKYWWSASPLITTTEEEAYNSMNEFFYDLNNYFITEKIYFTKKLIALREEARKICISINTNRKAYRSIHEWSTAVECQLERIKKERYQSQEQKKQEAFETLKNTIEKQIKKELKIL